MPLLEKEKEIDVPEIQSMKGLFWELGMFRSQGNGRLVQAIDPLRVQAHLDLSGVKVSKWEYNLIVEMDLVYRSTLMGRR